MGLCEVPFGREGAVSTFLLFLLFADALMRLNVDYLHPAKLILDLSRARFRIHELESFSHRFLLLFGAAAQK